jgi:pimeloyl-ACP methyl ester carboxylesterase
MPDSWESTCIAGKTADVFAPARPPRFGMVFLHDLDGITLAEEPVFTRLLTDHNLACVCPHGDQSWWGDRLCPEFDARVSPECYLLKSGLPFFEERWRLAPKAIGLLGIGMGGQGALRLAFKHARLFSTVAAIAPALDYHELYGQGTALDVMYDSKEQCRQDTALLHVPPNKPPAHLYFAIDPDDRWHRGCDRLHEKMNALGVEHSFELTPGGGGHTWEYFDKMAGRAMAFLVRGLDEESRRLL